MSTCLSCKFYDKHSAPGDKGLCRAALPVFRPELIVPDGHWPVVTDTDWCGHHTPVDGPVDNAEPVAAALALGEPEPPRKGRVR